MPGAARPGWSFIPARGRTALLRSKTVARRKIPADLKAGTAHFPRAARISTYVAPSQ